MHLSLSFLETKITHFLFNLSPYELRDLDHAEDAQIFHQNIVNDRYHNSKY